jgi:broad specificity phosphatase PhoE
MPELQWPILREMHIPRYKLPFQLGAYSWLLLTRILWMFGLSKGISVRIESFKAAKQRAKKAAQALHHLAEKQHNVIVFGHGFSNRYIRKELIKLGWQLERKSNDFWGVTCLKKQQTSYE